MPGLNGASSCRALPPAGTGCDDRMAPEPATKVAVPATPVLVATRVAGTSMPVPSMGMGAYQ